MITLEQAEILLANVRLHDGIRNMLWTSEIEETIELWKKMKWIIKIDNYNKEDNEKKEN